MHTDSPLVIENLSVKRSNKPVLDNISLTINCGEFVGLVGPNGGGKTTLLLTILGILRPSGGSIELYGYNSPPQQIFRKIGWVSQHASNIPKNIKITVRELVQLGTLNNSNMFSRISDDQNNRVEKAIERLGLTGVSDSNVSKLSGGQRQRVSIARTLIMKPKFVVCDEPTSMLDVSIRISIMDLMLNLAKDLEVSYLYITHDLAVARYMCNRIAVMFNGKIVEIAETEELLKNPVHPYTKRLISSIPVPDPTYERVVYDIDYTELDKIISTDTKKIGMVDIGNEHFVATHDVKGIL